jgi:small conductance mechanosensitive channel
MLEKPEVWGAQELSSKEVTMRIVAKTAPMRQVEVARELRARVKAVLDAAGVPPAGPDTIVITAPSGQGVQGGEAGALPGPGVLAAASAEARAGGELAGSQEDSAAELAQDEEGAEPRGEGAERATP